jgi:hypothetical protein
LSFFRNVRGYSGYALASSLVLKTLSRPFNDQLFFRQKRNRLEKTQNHRTGIFQYSNDSSKVPLGAALCTFSYFHFCFLYF